MGFLSDIVDLTKTELDAKLLTEIGLGILVLYWGSIVVYRLYLSPLAHFPGPKLAALTYWTEAYYELLHGEGGQFIFKYREWHEKYGPIIRITPRELHIQDASFFETFYAPAKPASKLKDLSDRLNMPNSAFSTPNPHLHKLRRGPLNPLFSKRRISERVPLIKRHMEALCERLKNEYQGKDRVLIVNEMFGCWTTDIIVEYCFERRYDLVQKPDFKAPFVASFIDMMEPIHWITQFPWMFKSMKMLPDAIVCWLNPRMKSVISFNNEMLAQVRESLDKAQEEDPKGQRADTIFSSIIQSDLPRTEITAERLHDEAVSVVGAGMETTMRTLTISIFHITNNSWVSQRLREELFSAIPDPENIPSWETLEQLPFLTACINESLRLSYGLSQRIPRVREKDAFSYGDYIIPSGTVVSMDIYGVSHDETIFPDSHTYNPARWLDTPRAPDGRLLTRYMVSFMRGPRSCVGMQLAYAELYIGLAILFRRFKFEIFETSQLDVALARECLVPKAKASSKGVRALV
ncbi:cytochrome P450, partial [Aspergillus venezuelensis]